MYTWSLGLHLLIQTFFRRVRVVVQNPFRETSVSGTVVLVLKISHLLSKVTGYNEWIHSLEQWPVDRHLNVTKKRQLLYNLCPSGGCNLQRVIFIKVLVPVISWSYTSPPRQNKSTLRGRWEEKLQSDTTCYFILFKQQLTIQLLTLGSFSFFFRPRLLFFIGEFWNENKLKDDWL